MNVSDLWDWAFMWSMFRNFTASAAPFIMVIVALAAVGMLLKIIISAVRGNKT